MSRIRRILQGICVGLVVVSAARPACTEEDDTRSVKILEGLPAPPTLEPSLATAPNEPETPAPKPAEKATEPDQPAATAKNDPQPSVAAPPVSTESFPTTLQKSSSLPVKVANSVDLSVEMLPGEVVSIGSRVSFRIKSKKAGYVILIDVDAGGKLKQIFPNTESLARNPRPNANFIKPGVPLLIPTAAETLSGVVYVVSPPVGNAMVVAVWGEQPVQILDLPDVSAEVTNQADALNYLTKWANELRIPDATSSRLREAKWSFDAKFYAVQ
jgi:Domain of unknown function (DUF4384)